MSINEEKNNLSNFEKKNNAFCHTKSLRGITAGKVGNGLFNAYPQTDHCIS